VPYGSCLSEKGWQGVYEAGVGKLESGGRELGGVGAGAREQDLVGHFTKGEAEGKGGDGEKRRAVELGGKCARELIVRNRIRGG
jgi:hypothetical protein